MIAGRASGAYVARMKRLRIRWWWLVIVLAAGYITIAAIYAGQAMSGRVTDGEIPLIGGVAEEPVTLHNGDIALDAGFYAHPAGAECAVVMIHGIDDDRSSVLRFAPLYWDHGCSV